MPTVVFPDEHLSLESRPDETILDAMFRCGLTKRYGCRRGGCGACKSQVLDGGVTYVRPIAWTVLSPSEREEGMCLTCSAVPDRDVRVRLVEGDRLQTLSSLLMKGRTKEIT